MLDLNIGDLVEMVPKNYSSPGKHVPDQWAGCTGIIINANSFGYTALIEHPEETAPIEILVSRRDVKILADLETKDI